MCASHHFWYFSGQRLCDLTGSVAGGPPGHDAAGLRLRRKGEVNVVDRFKRAGWLVVFVLFWLSRVLTRHRRWVLRSSVSEGEGQWGGWGEGGGRGQLCGPLPAEQVASAQSHKVDLAGASGPNRGKEYLERRQTDGDFTACYSHTHTLFSCAVWISTQEALKENSSRPSSPFEWFSDQAFCYQSRPCFTSINSFKPVDKNASLKPFFQNVKSLL